MQETGRKTVTLVLGGVRSGKSRWAQQRAAKAARVAYIATVFQCLTVANLFKPGLYSAAYARGSGPCEGIVSRCVFKPRSLRATGKHLKNRWNSGQIISEQAAEIVVISI